MTTAVDFEKAQTAVAIIVWVWQAYTISILVTALQIINLYLKQIAMASKKATSNSQKDVIVDSFLLNQPMYDLTPPPPLPFPKMYYYSLDPTRHYHHRFTAAYVANTKPLLIGSDLGLPVDELILFSKEYNSTDGILDEQDEALIKQTLMDSASKKKE